MAPKQTRSGVKVAALGGVAALCLYKGAFVPAPGAKARVPVTTAAGAAALAGASPAFADQIGDASAKLTEKAYPFFREVDWFNYIYNTRPGSASSLDWLKAIDKLIVMGKDFDGKLLSDAARAHHKAIGTIDANGVLSKSSLTDVDAAIGRLIASVPESSTLGVYEAFKGLTGENAANYLMSTVKAEDAKAAQAGLMAFKDVVKASPITPTEPVVNPKLSAAKLDAIGAAAGKLSEASYPFIKDVDWTSPVYLTPLPGVTSKEALQAVDKMLVMGASMDGRLLKDAAEAHHKAIAGVDSKGVLTAADYEAINAGIGKLIASVPQSQVMDVYNAFAKIIGNGVVANNMFQFSKGADAIGAYSAFLKFKDVVKAAQI